MRFRFLIGIGIFIILLIMWYDQSRDFFFFEEGKSITVWKRLGGACYIIPGRYYSPLKPSGCYVSTTSNGNFCVVWESTEDLIYSGHGQIVSDDTELNERQFKHYSSNEAFYDSLYKITGGNYRRFKDEVDYLCIDILESYIVSKGNAPD